jgi:hypothetical protein
VNDLLSCPFFSPIEQAVGSVIPAGIVFLAYIIPAYFMSGIPSGTAGDEYFTVPTYFGEYVHYMW